MSLRSLSLSELSIRGERALRPIGLYADLKSLLSRDGFRFRVPTEGSAHASRDRVLFLNLSFWGSGDSSDLLVDRHLDADVLAHAAWHHAARKALHADSVPTAAALFLGESIASAFDIYLVGQMLRQGKQTDFLKTQLPARSQAALGSGMKEEALNALFAGVAEGPEGAFEGLRALLFDVCMALYSAPTLDHAIDVFDRVAGQPFAGLLHHYALSTWLLYARAYAGPALIDDPAMAVDRALRAAPVSLDWLAERWLHPESR